MPVHGIGGALPPLGIDGVSRSKLYWAKYSDPEV